MSFNELEILKIIVRNKDSHFYEGPKYSQQSKYVKFIIGI